MAMNMKLREKWKMTNKEEAKMKVEGAFGEMQYLVDDRYNFVIRTTMFCLTYDGDVPGEKKWFITTRDGEMSGKGDSLERALESVISLFEEVADYTEEEFESEGMSRSNDYDYILQAFTEARGRIVPFRDWKYE